MDMSKYRDIFVAESRENIVALNKALLEFEKDPTALEPLDEIFRAMHSIKGMAAAMGFEDLAEFAHTTEDILDQMRKHTIQPSPDIIDLLFQAFDTLESFVEEITVGESLDTSFLNLKEQFEAIANDQLSPAEAVADELVSEPLDIAPDSLASESALIEVTIYLNKDCQMKGVRAFIVMKTLREMGDVVQTTPSESELEEEKFGTHFKVVLTSDEPKEKIQQAVLKILEVENVQIRDASLAAPEKSKQPAAQQQKTVFQKTKSVRVAIEHLDNLMNSVEELVLNRGRLARLTRPLGNAQISGIIEQLARLTTNLRDEVMQSRMVPASELFDRYPRLVRDISKELNKHVDLVIEGGDIELDRTVLDQINDPVVHLLRNAIDHGVENPESRAQQGKPERGVIEISVSRERSNVLITVEDDGKGMDPEQLRTRAVEKGMLSPEEANLLTDEEAFLLITRPGFSTSNVITDVSGRGVGMDVVRTRIRGLGGTLSIHSASGMGTSFGLRLPLTLAIIQGLEVDVYGEVYVIPLTHIVETMELAGHEIQTIKQEEVTILRGEVVPLVRLSEVLDVPSNGNGTNEFAAVIVEVGNRRRGLVVSRLIGQNEIVVKPLRGVINTVNLFTGVTILGDGQPAFILDVASFL